MATSQTCHIPHHDALLKASLWQQYESKRFCDLELIMGSDTLCVHSCVMAAFSPKVRLQAEFGSLHVPFDKAAVEVVVRALYSGVFRPDSYSVGFNQVMLAIQWFEVIELRDAVYFFTRNLHQSETVHLNVNDNINNSSKDIMALLSDVKNESLGPSSSKNMISRPEEHEHILLNNMNNLESTDAGMTSVIVTADHLESTDAESHFFCSEDDNDCESDVNGITVSFQRTTDRPKIENNGSLSQLEMPTLSNMLIAPTNSESTRHFDSFNLEVQVKQEFVSYDNEFVTNNKIPGPFKRQPKEIDHQSTSESYKCEMCNKSFIRKNSVLRHMKRTHLAPNGQIKRGAPRDIDPRHWCRFCEYAFDSKYELKKHYEQNHMKCRFCGQQFDRQVKLQKHCLAEHGEKEVFLCTKEGCGFKASHLFRFILHVKAKHKFLDCSNKEAKIVINQQMSKGKFPCKICSRSFSRREILTKHHLLKHTNQDHLKCRFCSTKFKIQVELHAHCLDVHHEQHPFMCERDGCAFTCGRFRNMIRHVQSFHDKTKTYTCEDCGSSFSHRNSFTSHRLCCLNMRTFVCDYCGKSFNLRASMLSHYKTQHLGEKKLQCQFCPKLFSHHGNLKRHLLIHNNAFPYTCNICNQKFRHSNSLKDHIQRIHNSKKTAIG